MTWHVMSAIKPQSHHFDREGRNSSFELSWTMLVRMCTNITGRLTMVGWPRPYACGADVDLLRVNSLQPISSEGDGRLTSRRAKRRRELPTTGRGLTTVSAVIISV